jgi:hypothetical protein
MLHISSLSITIQDHFKKVSHAGCWWLTLITLATQEVAIRRIEVQSQPEQKVLETLCQTDPSQTRLNV